MAPRLGLWVNMVRIFLDPLRGTVLQKLFGPVIENWFRRRTPPPKKKLKYISCMMNMML
jgi:uncharacterized membrane protein YbaN (DUF454 family)